MFSFILRCRLAPTLVKSAQSCNLVLKSQASNMSEGLRPIVISGPSGSGKGTLLNRLFDEFKGCFAFSVSHTTRKPRKGEENGVAYHFVTTQEFEDLIKQNGFLEHAQFSGNYYGTSKKAVSDVINSGLLCVLEVEINGVKSIKKSDMQPRPRFIFIKPPSFEELKKRLEERGSETPESLQKRLDTCKESMDYAETGAYDHIITNDKLDDAYEELKGILKEDLQKVQARS